MVLSQFEYRAKRDIITPPNSAFYPIFSVKIDHYGGMFRDFFMLILSIHLSIHLSTHLSTHCIFALMETKKGAGKLPLS